MHTMAIIKQRWAYKRTKLKWVIWDIVQFSSYYMKRNTSAITTYNQNRDNINTGKGKSPKRVVKGVKLYNFSEISSYKNINRPYLNELKKEHIKNKLDLEKSTETRVARRIKRKEMFVSYSQNPFIVLPSHSKSQAAIHAADSPLTSNRNIVDQLNNLQQKRFGRESQSRQLDEFRSNAQNISALVMLQAKNAQRSPMPFRKGKNKSMIALGEKVKHYQQQEKEEIIFAVEMDFLEIVGMHEQKWRDKRQPQLNIFQLLYDRSFFQRNLAILDKYFFSFNSLLQKFQKFKIKTYRDLSLESRVNITKKPQGKTVDRFEPFNQTQLNFNDLMNVAAGRYSPEVVYQQLNMERANENANSSQIAQDQIVYPDNTCNRWTMAENHNQSIKEVGEYLKIALTKKQSNYQRLNVFRKEQIKQKMEKVCALVSQSIYDRKMHSELHSQIGKDIASFTDQNYKYPKKPHERDSLIRAKKEYKGKHEIIKLEQLLQTYRAAKQHQAKVKGLINKRI